MEDLARKKCLPCEGGLSPLTEVQIRPLLNGLPGWSRDGEGISRTFTFRDYHATMAFVNAAAWVSHREDHHPELLVGFNQCKVLYWTHAIGGLSENDFICAAKIDALFDV